MISQSHTAVVWRMHLPDIGDGHGVAVTTYLQYLFSHLKRYFRKFGEIHTIIDGTSIVIRERVYAVID